MYRARNGELLWAMDIAPVYPGGPDQPVRAHLIVKAEQARFGEVRTSECGQTFTGGTHSRGWWSTKPGNLPLQDHAICCGIETARSLAPEDVPSG